MAIIAENLCGVVMAFEFFKDLENNYVQDTERGVVLKKHGGGSGFKSFQFVENETVYNVVAETKSLGGINELWVIEGIRSDDLKDKRKPIELYDLILEALISYKNHAYKDLSDTITVRLA